MAKVKEGGVPRTLCCKAPYMRNHRGGPSYLHLHASSLKVIEKREEIDWRRNGAFAAFGFLYLGGVQYALYVPIFGRLFPNAAAFAAKPVVEKLKDAPGIRSLFSQLFLDQCIHHPLMYFPIFYMMKDAITSDKPDPVKAVGQFINNSREDMFALWKVRAGPKRIGLLNVVWDTAHQDSSPPRSDAPGLAP